MKVLVGAFNQEKALVGAFSVIVKTDCGTDGSFYGTSQQSVGSKQLISLLGNTAAEPVQHYPAYI